MWCTGCGRPVWVVAVALIYPDEWGYSWTRRLVILSGVAGEARGRWGSSDVTCTGLCRRGVVWGLTGISCGLNCRSGRDGEDGGGSSESAKCLRKRRRLSLGSSRPRLHHEHTRTTGCGSTHRQHKHVLLRGPVCLRGSGFASIDIRPTVESA